MQTNAPHIVIITPIAPFPPRSGGTHHLYHFLKTLRAQSHYRLTVCLLSATPTAVTWGDLPTLGIECLVFAQTPRSRAWWLPPIARTWHSTDLNAYLASLWQHRPPDLVQIEFSGLAHLIDQIPHTCPTLITLYNVDTRALLARLAHTHAWWSYLRRWLGTHLVAAYERHYLAKFDRIITLSQADADFVHSHWRHSHTTVIPSGINIPTSPAPPLPTQARVLFVGNGRHQPNHDGMMWFLQHCWADIRRQLPDCELHLVGDALPHYDLPGIVWHGMVPDVTPYYHAARVVIAPIGWGAGVRIKILEACAQHRPIVATSAACDGLDVTAQHLVIADDPAQFRNAVIMLCRDSAQAQELAHAAYTWVQSYTWPHIIQHSLACYRTLIAHDTPSAEG